MSESTAVVRGSVKRVQICRHVASLCLCNAEVGHGGAGLDLLRGHDPPNQLIGGVGYLARNIGAAGELSEWRANQSIGSAHSRNLMTGATTVGRNRCFAAGSITPGNGTLRKVVAAPGEQQCRSNDCNDEVPGSSAHGSTHGVSRTMPSPPKMIPSTKTALTKTPLNAMNRARGLPTSSSRSGDSPIGC